MPSSLSSRNSVFTDAHLRINSNHTVALCRFFILGRGCKLLKTVSTRISPHFPQIWECTRFSELINNSRKRPYCCGNTFLIVLLLNYSILFCSFFAQKPLFERDKLDISTVLR